MMNSKISVLGVACAGLLISGGVASATTLLFEDFEDSDVTYTSSSPDDLSRLASSDYYGRVEDADLPSNISYGNVQGEGFFAVQDTDGYQVSASSDFTPVDSLQLNWSNLDIAGYTDLNLSFMFAESDALDQFEDWDKSSSVKIDVQIDGGGFDTVFAIESTPGNNPSDVYNETNRSASVDTDFDGKGDGAVITSDFTLFDVMLGVGTTLDIRLTLVDINANDEDIAFDNIKLSGSSLTQRQAIDPAPVPLPAGGLLLGSALLGAGLMRRRRLASK